MDGLNLERGRRTSLGTPRIEICRAECCTCTVISCQTCAEINANESIITPIQCSFYVQIACGTSRWSLLSFLMFDNLPTPTAQCVSDIALQTMTRCPYYLLGKNLPGSGILYRTSLSALTFQATAVMPATTSAMTAVLAFQLCGCAYQPPAGDHICFLQL